MIPLLSLIPPAPLVPRFDVVHADREGVLVPVVSEVERETRRFVLARESVLVAEMRKERGL